MKILIATKPEDPHADAVGGALVARGHAVMRWHPAWFPQRQAISARFGAAGPQVGMDAAFDPLDADVVWNRRREAPRIDPALHPDDRRFARNECVDFCDGLWGLVGPRAFWVNAEDAARRARSKLVQLALAPRVGLALPATLVSNDPREVRAFVAAHDGRCVYKPLGTGDWTEDGRLFVLYTAPVDAATLPDDAVLQSCPGIYQARLEKSFEVRATFMGTSSCAVRIASQETAHGRVDWRRAQETGDLAASPIAVPPAVAEACQRLLRELGLVFGCFDFVVTPRGEWTFLEVNEMGQFLFLEQWCRELPLLDMFCQFLERADPAFRYVRPAQPVRLDAVFDAVASAA